MDGALIATVNEGDGLYVNSISVENGHLMVEYEKEDGEMAKVDLGQVVGPAGPQGDTGAQGPQGARGPQGEPGISPTFSIEEGHLYADYDNPYEP